MDARTSKKASLHTVIARSSAIAFLAGSLVACAGFPIRGDADLPRAEEELALATGACTTDSKSSHTTVTGATLDKHFKFLLTGTKQLSSRQILDGIAAAGAPPPVDGHGAFSQGNFERELLQISALYWDLGYANVKLGVPSVDVERREITIPIDEGPRFTISSVAVTGELVGGVPNNYALLRTHAGGTFSRTMIAEDRERLRTYYQDLGYAYARVSPSTKVDLEHQQISLTFEIATGKLVHIDRIDVGDNVNTSREAILRDLQIAPGDLFSATKLAAAKCQILAAEPVEHVVIMTIPGDSDELIDVLVELSE